MNRSSAQTELATLQAHIWRRRNTPAPDHPEEAEKLAWREQEAKLKLRIKGEKK